MPKMMDCFFLNNFASNPKLCVKVFSHRKSLQLSYPARFLCHGSESRRCSPGSTLLRVASNEVRQRTALPLSFWAFTPIAPCHTLAQTSQNASPHCGPTDPGGSALVSHNFSWLWGFWTQAGRCEESLRDESQLCIWLHLCAFTVANSISCPSPILMQTSGWIAALYKRQKAPGRRVQTKTPSLYGDEPKRHFLFVLVFKEWSDDKWSLLIYAPVRLV